MMFLPTSVDPVNDSVMMPGCSASGPPRSSPRPVSTFSTGGGRNFWHTFAMNGPAYGMIVQTDQPLAARFALFVMS